MIDSDHTEPMRPGEKPLYEYYEKTFEFWRKTMAAVHWMMVGIVFVSALIQVFRFLP